MIIETKFSLNDKVYYTKQREKKVIIKNCKKCDGTGELKLLNGGSITCNQCYGKCGETSYLLYLIPSTVQSKIGKINIEIDRVDICDNYNTKINYMIESTGIGSGQCHNEHTLFKTLDECKHYCEVESAKNLNKFNKQHVILYKEN